MKLHHIHLALVIIALNHMRQIHSLSSGAPVGACNTLTPSHGDSKPQPSDTIPYELTLKNANGPTVEADEELEMVLKKVDDNAPDFKGFIVQARYADGDKAVIGEFELEHGNHGKHVACGGNGKNTITHKNSDPKTKVVFNWEHPEFESGPDKNVEFMFSVVQNFTTFWVQQPLKEGTVVVTPKV